MKIKSCKTLALCASFAGALAGAPVLLGASGCAQTPEAKSPFVPVEEIARPQRDGKDLVVFREVRDRVTFDWSFKEDEGTTTIRRHILIEAVGEPPSDLASWRLPPLVDKAQVTELKARTIAPDGTVAEVPNDKVFVATSRDGETTLTERVFQFPRVERGSILELVFEVKAPLEIGGGLPIALGYPVEKYSAEYVAEKRIDFDLAVWGADVKFDVADEGDMNKVSFVLHDVPADVWEPLHPAPTERIPYVYIRGVKLVLPKSVTYIESSWERALGGTARLLMGKNKDRVRNADRDLHRGMTLAVDASSCADQRCVAAKALDVVREATRFRGFGDRVRPMKEVLAEGAANSAEKNVLLWKLLEDAGVPARLGFAVRKGTGPFLDDLPTGFFLNANVVEILPTDGVAEPIYVDASCEHCALGEIPVWLQGQKGVFFSHSASSPWDDTDMHAEVKPIRGAVQTVDLVENRYEVAFQGDDAPAQIAWTRKRAGYPALFTAVDLRDKTAKDQRREAVRLVASKSARGKLVEAQPMSCERQRATCVAQIKMAMPSFGSRVGAPGGDLRVVSLGLFGNSWDGALRGPAAERRHDVVIDDADTLVEELVVQVPAGWSVASVPGERTVTSGAFTATVSAEQQDGKVIVRRKLDVRAGRYPKAQYQELQDALRAYQRMQLETVVLKKASGA